MGERYRAAIASCRKSRRIASLGEGGWHCRQLLPLPALAATPGVSIYGSKNAVRSTREEPPEPRGTESSGARARPGAWPRQRAGSWATPLHRGRRNLLPFLIARAGGSDRSCQRSQRGRSLECQFRRGLSRAPCFKVRVDLVDVPSARARSRDALSALALKKAEVDARRVLAFRRELGSRFGRWKLFVGVIQKAGYPPGQGVPCPGGGGLRRAAGGIVRLSWPIASPRRELSCTAQGSAVVGA